ncbi:MAG: hypothetical protein ACQJCO_01400 [cyanobacterium endosymbiont of Rhopalodia sterrenbergii]
MINNSNIIGVTVDIEIMTDLGNATNYSNVIFLDLGVTCDIKLGTNSEVVLARKKEKCVISLSDHLLSQQCFTGLSEELVLIVSSTKQVIKLTH